MSPNIKKTLIILAVFLGAYFIPFRDPPIINSIMEGFYMVQYYARAHVLTCLIPAFFIAGAIANFVSQGAILKYFGANANKWLCYSVASVSGVVLAVCSCTILPLFAGIYNRGAGIGPATAFLYAGPAINLLAIILTARVLGYELGIARAIGAIVFSIVIGLLMAAFFRADEEKRCEGNMVMPEAEKEKRSPLQNLAYFLTLILILLVATMREPGSGQGFWMAFYSYRWLAVAALLALVAAISFFWFNRDERVSWMESTWDFSLQIFPLLFAGVFVAGLLMGRPGSEAGLIPAHYIQALVGGNSLRANFVASFVGAFMYFATLTEIPILEGLIGSGMGKGPALSLLLAGPALSLPNMLVIRSVLGTKKTVVLSLLVVVMATVSGMIFGTFFS